MDVSSLIRDGGKIKATLEEKDGRLITRTGCKIYFPRHYTAGSLGSIEANVRTIGFYAIVLDSGHYAVNKTCATITLTPDTINVVTIDEASYLELTYEKGSSIMAGIDIIKNTTLQYNIYDEIVYKGKTPWYFSYADLGALFDSAQFHGDVNLGASHSILEMMAASRARDPKNRASYYRNALKTQADLDKIQPDIIPLRSVAYGATNTSARLLGAYLNEGMTSALINPSERLERVEELLLS